MPTTPPSQPPPDSGGIHIGDVGGSVNFSALGDIVGGNKITTITTTIQISVEAITQRPLVTASPYRGLNRFEDRDKDLFFGRDQLIKSLLAQLSASNVLLVLGASGSGKSSVVRAGLLPQLSQLIGAKFRYFTLVPDVNPFESLRSALQGAGFSQAQTRELADTRPETPANLIQTLQRGGDQWLFFVDQFEEIFTVGDEKLRASFIAALVQIAQDPNSSTKLVLAMRADFLDRFSPFPQFAKIIEKNIDFVADMHADELRQAIEQPAARHGVVFEQGLVEEIIKEVQGQAGSLPLLQYTLDLLWQEEAREDGLADRHLNTKAYRELGGVRGALQKRANEIYASFGDGSDAKAATPKQEIVRQIFLRLVDLAGEGSDAAAWRPVRRRASMAMFTTSQEREILQALIDQKLLVSNREGDDATVEVAHEALFTSWGRLKNWIEAGKQVIFAKNRLADDALRWQRRQQERDRGADEELLSGSRLAQALDLRARGDFVTVIGGLGDSENLFLDRSAALREKRARLRRVLEAVGIVLLLISITGAVFGWLGQRTARREATKTKAALSRSDRETAGRLSANQQPATAIAYLARSLENAPGNRLALADLLTIALETSWLVPASAPVHLTNEITDVLFSPDATRILINSAQPQTGEGKSEWHLYGRSGSNDLRLVADLGEAERLAFSSDGQTIIEASQAEQRGKARWESVNGGAVSGHVVLEQFLPKPRYRANFKPHLPGTVQVVDEANKAIGAPMYHALPVEFAWASPDGTHAVTGEVRDFEINLFIWGVRGNRASLLRTVGDADPIKVRFSPGGRYLALDVDYHDPSKGKKTELYRLDSSRNLEEPITQPIEFFAEVRGAEFSADGRLSISAHANGLLQLWHLADPPSAGAQTSNSQTAAANNAPIEETLRGHTDRFHTIGDAGHPGEELDAAALAKLRVPVPADTGEETHAAWANPSKRYILFKAEKTWQLWDDKTGHRTDLNLPNEAGVTSIFFSSDGRWLAFQVRHTGGIPAAIHLVALETGLHRTQPWDSVDLIFSKSAQFLLVLGTDDEVQVFDTATLELCTTYRNPIQDRFWGTEKILQVESTPELCAVLTALGGKRLGATGTTENLPPTEWLNLRGDIKPTGSFTNAVVRWILDWPGDRSVPPF